MALLFEGGDDVGEFAEHDFVAGDVGRGGEDEGEGEDEFVAGVVWGGEDGGEGEEEEGWGAGGEGWGVEG